MNDGPGRSGDPMRHTTDGAPVPVRRRILLHAPGFEPLTAGQHRDRLARTLEHTAAAWSLAAGCGPVLSPEPGASSPRIQAWAEGPDWRTESEVRLLAWDELIRAELARPLPARLARGGGALIDVLATGTVARYARAHWRYALFALFPVGVLAAATGAAAGAGAALGGLAGTALGAGVLAGLLAVARRHLLLDVMLADWRFAVDVARGRNPAYAALIGRFAGEIAAALRRRDVDEVVLAGHSLGSVVAIQALAEAVRRDPALLHAGIPRLALLGFGSSTLKIALHPAAEPLRRDLALLAATERLAWCDYASRRDILSFERSEAVATLGLPGRGARLESIHPRDMVDARRWRRIGWQPLRIHRQYVMGNARRYFLDFGLIACGPLPVGAGLRADRVLGPDGALGVAPRRADAPHTVSPMPKEHAA